MNTRPDVRQQVELLAWESTGARNPALQLDDLKTRAIKGDVTQAPLVVAAMRLLDQQRFQEAEQVCLDWCKLEPQNPLAWRLLGRTYEGQGRGNEARTAIAQAEHLAQHVCD